MRYFLAGFALLAVLVVGIAGFRGSMSRRPPIEVFPDMDRQLKLRPQTPNNFFADGRASRLPVAGTIARSTPYNNLAGATPERAVYPYENAPVNTGQIAGTTNFVETGPFAITAQFMERGRARYAIYCSPCHGELGDGNGVTKKLGMNTVANLHEARIVRLGDGELFHVISNGRNLMGPYAAQIDVEDRWAVVAYVRALQLSRLASTNDVPEQLRSTLKK
jgi:mono/diheme cytochrome c family protein